MRRGFRREIRPNPPHIAEETSQQPDPGHLAGSPSRGEKTAGAMMAAPRRRANARPRPQPPPGARADAITVREFLRKLGEDPEYLPVKEQLGEPLSPAQREILDAARRIQPPEAMGGPRRQTPDDPRSSGPAGTPGPRSPPASSACRDPAGWRPPASSPPSFSDPGGWSRSCRPDPTGSGIAW